MSYAFTVPDELIDRNPPVEPPLDESEARRRYGRLLQASARAARSLADLDRRFANDADWASAPERFRADVDAVGRDIAESFEDDRTGRALFLRDYGRLAEAKTGAFARLSVEREGQAIAAAYADRMTTLAEIARRSGGPQRDEAIRQATLEAHRAHAFGLADDPAAEAERFVVEIRPSYPENAGGGSFGASTPSPPDRTEYERQAKEGWQSPARVEDVAKASASAQPPVDAQRAGTAFGFSDSALTQRNRERYTTIQNIGDPRDARTPEVIGKDYWAAKKALDVDSNDVKAQELLERTDRELNLYPIKKALAGLIEGEAKEHFIGVDKLSRLAPPVGVALALWSTYEAIDTYLKAKEEISKIRSDR